MFVVSVCISCHDLLNRKHKNTHLVSLSYSLPLSLCVLVHSQPLNVPVFLPQDGNLVPEQHRVQPHLGVNQGHETQPVAEGVHAGLTLGEVVRVGPPRRLGALGLEKQRMESVERAEDECVRAKKRRRNNQHRSAAGKNNPG